MSQKIKQDKYKWYNYLNSMSTNELKKALFTCYKQQEELHLDWTATIEKIVIVLKDRGLTEKDFNY